MLRWAGIFFICCSFLIGSDIKKENNIWLRIGDVFNSQGKRLNAKVLTLNSDLLIKRIRKLDFNLRITPLFLYLSKDLSVYGLGIGINHKFYPIKNDSNLLFFEIFLTPLLHFNKFPENSTYVNIYSEFGIGYKSKNFPLFASLKINHLSNANIGKKNRGWNSLALGIGLYYKRDNLKDV